MFDHKKWVKNGQNFRCFQYENEIHRIDSPFNEKSKNIIFLDREVLISGVGQLENLGKSANSGNLLLYKLWSGLF